MAQRGNVRVLRATGTTSVGTANGAIITGVVVTHNSNTRVVCHIKASTTNGAANIRIPFDADFASTPARKTTAVFVDEGGEGLPISGGKAFVKISGASVAAYVYYRNID